MTEVQRLQQLKDVVAHVKICKPRVKNFEVHVVYVLCYETGYLRGRIPHDIQQSNNVWAAGQILQDLDLSFDLLLLDGLEDLNDTLLVADDVYTLENLKDIRTVRL